MPLGVGNLIRWRKGQTGADVGVVIDAAHGGQLVRVRLDNGEEFQ